MADDSTWKLFQQVEVGYCIHIVQRRKKDKLKFLPTSQETVLRIRIRMFLGLPDSDPLVRGTDPDPSIIKQNLDSYCSATSF